MVKQKKIKEHAPLFKVNFSTLSMKFSNDIIYQIDRFAIECFEFISIVYSFLYV